jgi:hypothetical protein
MVIGDLDVVGAIPILEREEKLYEGVITLTVLAACFEAICCWFVIV